MGAADLMPGISGGSVAFISGIYKDLIDSIKSFDQHSLKLLLSVRIRDFFASIAWEFLLTLGLGLASSFLLFSRFFAYFLNHSVFFTYLYAIFFGFVAGSILLCSKMLNTWNNRWTFYLLLGFITAFVFMQQDWSSSSKRYSLQLDSAQYYTMGQTLANYDRNKKILSDLSSHDLAALLAQKKVDEKTRVFDAKNQQIFHLNELVSPSTLSFFDLWVFFCGSLAVCAMLLPGISGSYLLNTVGLYPAVVASLADLSRSIEILSLDVEALRFLLNLAFGAFFGAVCFSRLISKVMDKYRDPMVLFLIGMMAGAMPSVWPFWQVEYRFLAFKIEQGPKLSLLRPLWPNFYSFEFYLVCLLSLCSFFAIAWIERRAKHLALKA